MTDPLEPLQPESPTRGPFFTAALALAVAIALLITLQSGLKLTMVIFMSVVIPGMTVPTLLVSISMGWIFVSIGRSKITPRWLKATWIIISITMLVLLWLTHVADSAGKIE